MARQLVALALVFFLVPFVQAADYSIKTVTAAPPKELNESIAKLLGDRAIQLLDTKGVVAEVWFRKELSGKATAEQVKNGLTYRELDETGILGAVRFEQQVTDYRQQKIRPGVYTLRLGFQPMDGDHMGTAPHSEFALLAPAHADVKTATMSAKELQELSTKASGSSHPAVLLLFPNDSPEDAPKLVDKGNQTWVLQVKQPVMAANQKGTIGIGLTLIGHSEQ